MTGQRLPRRVLAEMRWQAARKAREVRCTCGVTVWFGLDDDECAMSATVEQRVIELAWAEVMQADGVTLYFRDGGGRLWRLEGSNIRGSFVRDRLLVEHVCQESAA